VTALGVRLPLAATVSSGAAAPSGIGASVIRPATAADHAALAEMAGRCSELTRYFRFHSPVRTIPERYLAEALSGVAEHCALVAVAPSGAVTALASRRTIAPGEAELGVLVEDGSQRLGLGRLLLHNLIHQAERPVVTVFRATILREQAWITRLLSAYGPCRVTAAGYALDVTLRPAACREPRAERAGP
jgi:GNAT superfamily N-acetyltransferase